MCSTVQILLRAAALLAAAGKPVAAQAGSCLYGDARTDKLNMGVNAGGVWLCSSDGTAAGALAGDALRDACASVCSADGNCRMFEVAPPQAARHYHAQHMYNYGVGPGINCAIEHVAMAGAQNPTDRDSTGNCWAEAS